jgi:hypothetical protein
VLPGGVFGRNCFLCPAAPGRLAWSLDGKGDTMQHYVLFFTAAVTLLARPATADNTLIRGFVDKDNKPLIAFVNKWHSASKPITSEVLAKKPQFEQELYAVYQAFYAPAKFYSQTDFVVVQNQVDVQIVGRDLTELYRKMPNDIDDQISAIPVVSDYTVKAFRPEIRNTKKKVLYLDDDHLESMLYFLTRKNASPKELWHIKSASDIRLRRLAYLNKVLHILPGHWGIGWHFETHPHVYSVVLDSKFRHALIIFREHYGGGYALMESKDGKWVVLKQVDSWIE